MEKSIVTKFSEFEENEKDWYACWKFLDVISSFSIKMKARLKYKFGVIAALNTKNYTNKYENKKKYHINYMLI